MKTKVFLIFVLLCAVAQGAWAQTTVSTDSELRAAIQTDGANITVTADIDLSNSTLSIEGGKTITIDLGGHTLDRKLKWRGEGGGQVITVREGATLNLSNGTLKGGWGGASGGINNEGGTVNLTDVTITGCVGDDRGGGICNRSGGILNMMGGSITNNISNDKTAPEGGGGLFNAEGATATLTGVTITGNIAKLWGGGGICNYGTLTLDSCTITGNEAKLWEGGGICNHGTLTIGGCTITGNTCPYSGGGIYTAAGATLTLDGCTITGNTCGYNGGGICTVASSMLNMKGKITIADNTTVDGATNNLFMKADAVITVTGSLFGSSIGISMEALGVFTSGYMAKNSSIDPATIFFSDLPMIMNISSTKKEAKMDYRGSFSFIECSWDDVNREVVYTTKTLNYYLDDINIAPYTETDYKVITSGPGVYSLGGRSTRHPDYPEYFIARGNIQRDAIRVEGTKVHLILCDGASLNVNYLMVNPGYKLYIHSQSYGASMGKLNVNNNGYNDYTAGIGSGNGGTHDSYKEGPELIEIHGGNIYAQGGDNAAGIGGGEWCKGGNIVIYGGNIKAYGGEGGGTDGSAGAGIGGGNFNSGGNVTVYGGSVYAKGGPDAAGIGSGNCGYLAEHYSGHGGWFTMYGGYVEAHGADNGAGIGAGEYSAGPKEVNIYGGTVKAYGGEDAAGIGGGYFTTGNFDSGTVNIYGGEVYAYGKEEGAGIGGGENGNGALVKIMGGTVVAQAGKNETGYKAIGGGRDGDNNGSLTLGDDRCVYITSNLWRSQKANRVSDSWGTQYLQINECLHGDATVSIVGADKHNMTNCKWCYITGEEAHTFGEDSQCSVCKLIRLEDEGDNSALFTKWNDGEAHDFLLSGRKLETNSQIVNGEIVKSSKAYTVCLPFDMDLTGRDDLMVYTLGYIKDGSEMVFTQTAKKIEAGKPYLIVIHQGELELLGHSPLIATASEGVRVYDWENREQPLGWWRGTLTKIESADAAAMMAYALQSVGDFRRIRPDTPQAWWGAFRSMYCPDELPTTNRFTINKGTFGGFGGETVTVTFEGDADIQDGTGIDEIKNVPPAPDRREENLKMKNDSWYNLSGQRLSKPQKGINIVNGTKVIIN